MKSISFVLLFPIGILLSTASCNKNKCADCHYDKAGAEIEMGEYCGDDLKQLEALGTYTDSTGIYTVHCEEH